MVAYVDDDVAAYVDDDMTTYMDDSVALWLPTWTTTWLPTWTTTWLPMWMTMSPHFQPTRCTDHKKFWPTKFNKFFSPFHDYNSSPWISFDV
jgi:hypothetical protein